MVFAVAYIEHFTCGVFCSTCFQISIYYIGYKCKTKDCEMWLMRKPLPDDSPRTVTVPLRVTPFSEKVTCPECKQEHEYTEADVHKVIIAEES